MSDEPNLPPIPSLGDVLTRKNMEEFKTTILKCIKCGNKMKRPFEEGDYIYRKFQGKPCSKCSNEDYLILEIFADYRKSKKKEKK